MVYVGKKKLNIKYFLITMLTIAAAILCILKIGGLTATIAVIIYCILLGLTIIGILEQMFNPKAVGKRLGIKTDLKTGKASIDMSRYDQFIDRYEHRFSNIWFWLDIPIAMSWIVIFLVGGFPIISYMTPGVYMCSEIGRYRIYKIVKDNKTAWGAAAYVNEIQNFFGKKRE